MVSIERIPTAAQRRGNRENIVQNQFEIFN